MNEWLIRSEKLLGTEAINKLNNSKVCVFGIGGVGGYVCEGLARSGVGSFILVDKDVVSESNINRQIIATTKTVGKSKTELMKERILDINPNAVVETKDMFYLPDTAGEIDFSDCDYVVDAVDTVTAKLLIIQMTKEMGIPVISSMGTGNKLDPTCFRIDDISKTSVCPLAKVMRKELKDRGISDVKVLYSTENPAVSGSSEVIPSISFVPSVAGLIIAGEVIKDITGVK